MLASRLSLHAASPPVSSEEGFSILETIVAIALLTTALVTLAQLAAAATVNNRTARNVSSAAMLAQQKMEQLRARQWDALAPSPPRSIEESIDGWVDYLDQRGSLLGGGSSPRPGTVFIRRWSITDLTSSPGAACVLVVQVMPIDGRRATSSNDRLPADVRITSVRARK